MEKAKNIIPELAKVLVLVFLLVLQNQSHASCADLFKQLFVNPHLSKMEALSPNFVGKRLTGYKALARQPLALTFWSEDKAEMFLPEDAIKQEAFVAPDGKLVRKDGALLNTKGESEGQRHFHSILVLTPDGRMLVLNMNDQKYRHHHSSWGSWVRFAGEIDVVDGKITFLNNNSGHFQTSKTRFAKFLELLIKNGVVVDDSVEILVYTREYFYKSKVTELLE